MGILKLEIDLPSFEKEISLSIIVRKDGEVITSLSPDLNKTEEPVKKETGRKTATKKAVTGNYMEADYE